MPTGCCGMAGSFGFEAEKYHWSMKIAERALLPKIREAPADAVVLANGFSCREQIEQGTGRETRHVAELIAEGMGYPVAKTASGEATANGYRDLAVAGGIFAAGLLLGAALRRRSAYRGAGEAAALSRR